MNPTNSSQPSAGARRAALRIKTQSISKFHQNLAAPVVMLAEIIDRETGAKELVEALRLIADSTPGDPETQDVSSLADDVNRMIRIAQTVLARQKN